MGIDFLAGFNWPNKVTTGSDRPGVWLSDIVKLLPAAYVGVA